MLCCEKNIFDENVLCTWGHLKYLHTHIGALLWKILEKPGTDKENWNITKSLRWQKSSFKFVFTWRFLFIVWRVNWLLFVLLNKPIYSFTWKLTVSHGLKRRRTRLTYIVKIPEVFIYMNYNEDFLLRLQITLK